jgi:hypothetical protein
MYEPKTMEAYYELVEQACFEAGDLVAAIEFDDFEDPAAAFAGELEQRLVRLKEQMQTGTYRFDPDEDLPFMEIVRAGGEQIPFRILLEDINRVHRNGLYVDAED